MAITAATHDSKKTQTKVIDATLDTYATGGLSFPASLAELEYILVALAAPASGYVFRYDPTTKKLLAYRSAGFTPAGSVSAHAHDLLVKGAATGGIDEPIGVEGTDTLAKDAATDRTIAGADSATKGGVRSTTSTFTGTAVAAGGLVEVANGVDLSAVVTRVLVIGR
jgi:hypothetical protein